MTTPTQPLDIGKLKEMLARFDADETGMQSRIILVHQLRAGADILDRETKRETGWADTSDRAARARKAADAIELLAERVERLEAALKPFAERLTIAEAMASIESAEWLNAPVERRIEMMGERKRANDAAIINARELLGMSAARNALSPATTEDQHG